MPENPEREAQERVHENVRSRPLAQPATRELYRFRPDVTAPGAAAVWSVVEFEGPDSCAEQLAEALAAALNDQHGWYVEFRSRTDTFIVFSGKHFRYPRGDEQGRAEARQYGRTVGVPEPQLDWPA